MDCAHARTLISARVDDESLVGEDGRLDDHLDTCASCRGWQERAHRLRRRTVIAPAASADLAPAVLARAAVPVTGRADWIRWLLASVGATLVLVDGPVLVGGSGADVHDGRHLGAFGVALGAGLVWAAFRPERARGLLPLTTVLAVALTGAVLIDVSAGRSDLGTESRHLLELTGLVLVWIVSGGARRLAARRVHRPVGPPLHPA